VSLQANRAHLKEVPSTWAVTKQIVSTQVWVSIWSISVWNEGFFLNKESICPLRGSASNII
jgi:hypothetical protein